jgi:hypothetical protein
MVTIHPQQAMAPNDSVDAVAIRMVDALDSVVGLHGDACSVWREPFTLSMAPRPAATLSARRSGRSGQLTASRGSAPLAALAACRGHSVSGGDAGCWYHPDQRGKGEE